VTPEQIEWLKQNLRFNLKTEESYVGSMGDGNGSLYKTYKYLELVLDGEVIDSVSFE
jgi:hypothetical protein